jgi:hypothetical protein
MVLRNHLMVAAEMLTRQTADGRGVRSAATALLRPGLPRRGRDDVSFPLPKMEALDVQLERLSTFVQGDPFDHELILGDGPVAAVARFFLGRAAPDAGDAVERRIDRRGR